MAATGPRGDTVCEILRAVRRISAITIRPKMAGIADCRLAAGEFTAQPFQSAIGNQQSAIV
jgi:hypothetical protein